MVSGLIRNQLPVYPVAGSSPVPSAPCSEGPEKGSRSRKSSERSAIRRGARQEGQE